jgi:hypothetical protein
VVGGGSRLPVVTLEPVDLIAHIRRGVFGLAVWIEHGLGVLGFIARRQPRCGAARSPAGIGLGRGVGPVFSCLSLGLVVHAPIATPHVRAPTFRPGDAGRVGGTSQGRERGVDHGPLPRRPAPSPGGWSIRVVRDGPDGAFGHRSCTRGRPDQRVAAIRSRGPPRRRRPGRAVGPHRGACHNRDSSSGGGGGGVGSPGGSGLIDSASGPAGRSVTSDHWSPLP